MSIDHTSNVEKPLDKMTKKELLVKIGTYKAELGDSLKPERDLATKKVFETEREGDKPAFLQQAYELLTLKNFAPAATVLQGLVKQAKLKPPHQKEIKKRLTEATDAESKQSALRHTWRRICAHCDLLEKFFEPMFGDNGVHAWKENLAPVEQSKLLKDTAHTLLATSGGEDFKAAIAEFRSKLNGGGGGGGSLGAAGAEAGVDGMEDQSKEKGPLADLIKKIKRLCRNIHRDDLPADVKRTEPSFSNWLRVQDEKALEALYNRLKELDERYSELHRKAKALFHALLDWAPNRLPDQVPKSESKFFELFDVQAEAGRYQMVQSLERWLQEGESLEPDNRDVTYVHEQRRAFSKLTMEQLKLSESKLPADVAARSNLEKLVSDKLIAAQRVLAKKPQNDGDRHAQRSALRKLGPVLAVVANTIKQQEKDRDAEALAAFGVTAKTKPPDLPAADDAKPQPPKETKVKKEDENEERPHGEAAEAEADETGEDNSPPGPDADEQDDNGDDSDASESESEEAEADDEEEPESDTVTELREQLAAEKVRADEAEKARDSALTGQQGLLAAVSKHKEELKLAQAASGSLPDEVRENLAKVAAAAEKLDPQALAAAIGGAVAKEIEPIAGIDLAGISTALTELQRVTEEIKANVAKIPTAPAGTPVTTGGAPASADGVRRLHRSLTFWGVIGACVIGVISIGVTIGAVSGAFSSTADEKTTVAPEVEVKDVELPESLQRLLDKQQ